MIWNITFCYKKLYKCNQIFLWRWTSQGKSIWRHKIAVENTWCSGIYYKQWRKWHRKWNIWTMPTQRNQNLETETTKSIECKFWKNFLSWKFGIYIYKHILKYVPVYILLNILGQITSYHSKTMSRGGRWVDIASPHWCTETKSKEWQYFKVSIVFLI